MKIGDRVVPPNSPNHPRKQEPPFERALLFDFKWVCCLLLGAFFSVAHGSYFVPTFE